MKDVKAALNLKRLKKKVLKASSVAAEGLVAKGRFGKGRGEQMKVQDQIPKKANLLGLQPRESSQVRLSEEEEQIGQVANEYRRGRDKRWGLDNNSRVEYGCQGSHNIKSIKFILVY